MRGDFGFAASISLRRAKGKMNSPRKSCLCFASVSVSVNSNLFPFLERVEGVYKLKIYGAWQCWAVF